MVAVRARLPARELPRARVGVAAEALVDDPHARGRLARELHLGAHLGGVRLAARLEERQVHRADGRLVEGLAEPRRGVGPRVDPG